MHKISLFFLLLSISIIVRSQGTITIYYESPLSTESRQTITDLTTSLNKSVKTNFVESGSLFNGKGIYITTRNRDRYRRYPAGLAKMGEEAFYLDSDNDHVYISGNSELAMREGIYTYLEKLGFRFYFPDPAWHIIPARKSIFSPFNILFEPSFSYRYINISWGEGSNSLMEKSYFWQRANRTGGAFQVNSGHAYNEMVIERKAEFIKHPEYLSQPLVNGNLQGGTVFNYASKGLQQLAYEWLAAKFDAAKAKGISLPMLSLEPFDGGTYCNLPECKAIGATASDQIFYFTNQVAAKLKKTHPGKKIGILAYNDHIDIPKFPVESNIFVTITQGFNKSNYSLEELTNRWKTKVPITGIYEYLSVLMWTGDLPGRGVVGNYKTLSKKLREYYSKGVRAYLGESTYAWIPNGLGHYIMARLCWDVKENEKKIADEFFSLCFPQSRKSVEKLYESWLTYVDRRPTQTDMKEWYTLVQSAFNTATNPVEIRRLEQIALYLYVINQWLDMQKANGTPAFTEKQSAFLSLLWSVMEEGVYSSYGALNEQASVLGTAYQPVQPDAPYKKTRASYPANKQQWLTFYQKQLPLMKGLDRSIALPEGIKIPPSSIVKFVEGSNWPNDQQYITTAYYSRMIVDLAHSDSLSLKVNAGRFTQAGSPKVTVYPWNDDLLLEGKPVKEFTITANNQWQILNLATLPKKKYIISYIDDGNGAYIHFPKKMKYSVVVSAQSPMMHGFSNGFYFYVPPGTKKFYISKNGFMRVSRPGKNWTDYPSNVEQAEITVGEKDAGWWVAWLQLENFYFVGIPPLISRSPESFLFP